MPDVTGLTYVTVIGTFVNNNGPSSGTVRFLPTGRWVNTTTDQILVPEPVSVALDPTGSFTARVPCTDDPDYLPVGRDIQVTEFIDGQTRNYAIILFGGVPVQNLANIAPIDPLIPGAVYQLAGQLVGPGAGVSDGDKGDIIVTGSGLVWTIDPTVLSDAARTVISQTTLQDMRTALGVDTGGDDLGDLLLETGDHLILESGDVLLLEGA